MTAIWRSLHRVLLACLVLGAIGLTALSQSPREPFNRRPNGGQLHTFSTPTTSNSPAFAPTTSQATIPQATIPRRATTSRPTAMRMAAFSQPPPTIPKSKPGSQIEQIRPKTPRPPLPKEPRRLSALPQLPNGLTDPPRRPEVEKEYGRFVKETIDPELPLDLIVGRPRMLRFHKPPRRIYLAQDSVATYDVISATEVSIVGVAPGSTVLSIWVDDPAKPGELKILSYLLRVNHDAAFKIRLDKVYRALEQEINRDFPDSFVRLSLVGDQLVVRGQAKDVVEAAHIIRILNEHAPPRRRRQRNNQTTNLNISQTSYSPGGVTQANRQFESTLERLLSAAGIEGDSNVVNLLSIPGEQQVMLRVTVAEVNRSALRSIGTHFRVTGDAGAGYLANFPPRVGDLTNATLMALEGGSFSVTRGDFRLTVDALKQHNLARTLAEPNLVTLHGRPARFQAGGQFPVPSARVGFGAAAQGVDFVPFGVQLQFVPFIVDRDKIRLTVAANVSTRDEALTTTVSGSNVPGLSTRNFQNTVELREGQTLAVAGLIQTNFGANSSRVPFLGDFPFLGRLFKRDTTSADEQELVILITPELVHPVEGNDRLPLPGADMLEPGDIEFYIKGQIESRKTGPFRSPSRTDWARLQRYRRCENELIIGPTGHSIGCRNVAPNSHMRSVPIPNAMSEPLPAGGPASNVGRQQ